MPPSSRSCRPSRMRSKRFFSNCWPRRAPHWPRRRAAARCPRARRACGDGASRGSRCPSRARAARAASSTRVRSRLMPSEVFAVWSTAILARRRVDRRMMLRLEPGRADHDRHARRDGGVEMGLQRVRARRNRPARRSPRQARRHRRRVAPPASSRRHRRRGDGAAHPSARAQIRCRCRSSIRRFMGEARERAASGTGAAPRRWAANNHRRE